MEKKKRERQPQLEELIPDEAKRKEVLSRMYNGDPLLGQGGIFTDMLQTLVNAALEGEIEGSHPLVPQGWLPMCPGKPAPTPTKEGAGMAALKKKNHQFFKTSLPD